MAKTSKDLEIQARYIYRSEIEDCPDCGEALEDRSYYQWRKTVQQLDGAVYVASRGKECVNPECDHQGEAHLSAAAQMVTVPDLHLRLGRDSPGRLVARSRALEPGSNPQPFEGV